MEKIVIIMNGAGGVGKDTICELTAKHYQTDNVSSIDPIKAIARINGWWNGEKDLKSRKFLAGLKSVFVEYNDLPTTHLVRCCEEFVSSDKEILFVHIREPEEIDKFKKAVIEKFGNQIPCVAMLVERDTGIESYGNASDDGVKNYRYDYYFYNNGTIEEAEENILKIIPEIYKDWRIEKIFGN